MSEPEFAINTEVKESERYKPWLSLVGAAQLVQKQTGEDDDIGDAMLKAAKSITEASTKIEKTVTAIMGNQFETELKRTKAAKEAAYKITKPVLARADTATAYAGSAIAKLAEQTHPGGRRTRLSNWPTRKSARHFIACLRASGRELCVKQSTTATMCSWPQPSPVQPC